MLHHSVSTSDMFPSLMNNVSGGLPMRFAVSEQIVTTATVFVLFTENPLRVVKTVVSSSYLRIVSVCVFLLSRGVRTGLPHATKHRKEQEERQRTGEQ